MRDRWRRLVESLLRYDHDEPLEQTADIRRESAAARQDARQARASIRQLRSDYLAYGRRMERK